MKSYQVYLTKSSGVAARIAKSYGCGGSLTEDVETISHGMVNENTELVPAIYRGKGFFYCTVTLKENGEHDAPTYELTIC